MTRKHFQLIADVIASSSLSDTDRAILVSAFCDKLQTQNANFDRARFVDACQSVEA